MPQLDAMLQALSRRGAHELRLTDGSRPTFRFADGDRPVSQVVLKRAQIVKLVAELASGTDAARVRAGEAARFEYRHPDGMPFQCRIRGENGDFEATLVPAGHDGAGPAAASAPAAPAPAAPAPPTVEAPSIQVPQTAAAGHAPDGSPAIDRYLRLIVDRGASDLHLSSGETPMLRVDGDMLRVDGEGAWTPEHTARLLFDIIPARNKAEFEDCNDTDFAYEIVGLARFRANIFMDRKGIGGVFRVIPSKILTAEDLSLSKEILNLCHLSKGLVLVTGPTGSGKSTTLAAMIDYINDRRTDHIITIEDPIEFVHPNKQCLVNQREIVTHTESFKKALRAALREDPDIVLVGEMRDLETIEIAIETAETGHLVFGTLHTTTACSTVDRIIDQFPSDRQGQIRTMLSESLKGVVSQTLLKKIGGGRVAALEVLITVPAVSNLIREGKTFQIPSIMQTGKKHGMVLLNDALMNLVRSKTVDPAEAYAKAIDRAGLAGSLRAGGFKFESTSDS